MIGDPQFLGRGWGFPPAFAAGGADVGMETGTDDIRQSLEILLATHPAERILGGEFGCDLTQFLFEEVDRSLVNGLKSLVTDAILLHEPRIQLNSVDLSTADEVNGRIQIVIDYTVRATNSRFNMVYPFYLNEAMTVIKPSR